MSKRFTLKEISKKINELYPNIIVLSEEYIGCGEKLKCKCLIEGCNNVWSTTWGTLRVSIKKGGGCPSCASKKRGFISSIPTEENKLSIVRPDLIKYFIKPNDADNYTVKSSKKIRLKCPDCHYIKTMTISTLSSHGFSCNNCGDGVSFPNKFIFGILKQFNIDFIPEKSFSWSCGRRYDFYIPDKNIVIEVHGIQHYESIKSRRTRSLQDEKDNDAIKQTLAITNNINYIEIDARCSDFLHLQKHSKISLEKYFDMDDIDLENVSSCCKTSLLVSTCELYSKNNSAKDISEILKISDATARRYLRNGRYMGIVDYLHYDVLRKEINQYALDGHFIKSYSSQTEASIETGIHSANINSALKRGVKNKKATSGGFIWKYK